MIPSTLVADFICRDIKLSVAGDQLAYDAPSGVLTPEDLEALRKHKADLIVHLSERTSDASPDHQSPVTPYRRPPVGSLPLTLRQRWGDLANELMDAGMPWPDHEAEAYRRVREECRDVQS